jgi:CHAD domain-containing protein
LAKARKIPYLKPDEALGIAIEKILRTRFEEMISFEENTVKREDIESLHDMRVASRRLQALMRIFRKSFKRKKFKEEYSELRLLIRALGAVRDYDVLIGRIEELKNKFPATDTRALDLIIIRKKSLREMKMKELKKHIDQLNRAGYKENFYRFILTGKNSIREPLRKHLSKAIPELMNDFIRYKNDVAGYPSRKTLLHEMRKKGKPLRYSLELGEYCFKSIGEILEEIKDTIELMGEIHDTDVMIPELITCLKEIRILNNTVTDIGKRISTKQIRDIIRHLREERRRNFSRLQHKLNYITSADFTGKFEGALRNA